MAESCDLTGTGSDDRCGPGIINPENSRDESATLSLSEMLGSCFHANDKFSGKSSVDKTYSIVILPEVACGSSSVLPKKGRVGRPRTKPLQKKTDWHYHLGGLRHSRVPLSAELKEVLEVAYVSRVMSKNFRKEGQPEKERIAHISGMELEKVQEWFKNRRKKEKHQVAKDFSSLWTPHLRQTS